MSIKFEYRDIDSLIPYENNPRKHTSIKRLEKSVEEYGFINPIIIDEYDVILSGHGRLMAAKKEGLEQVPCIRVDHLDEEGKIGFRIADNSSAEESEWDNKKLKLELEKIDFKLDEFKLDFEEHDYAEETQEKVENILGLGRGQFEGEGYYDIPTIQGIQEMPEVREWIGFNYVLSDKDPEGKGVHFFVDDYQFERVWNNPEKYVEKLKQYKAVLSPDFSPYGDMPLAAQIWNHYRKHWCAAYWQLHGITVLPTIRASSDPRSLDWYLDGEPRESIVAISTMWESELPKEMENTYNDMMQKLKPTHLVVYGPVQEYMDERMITHIPTFSEKRFKTDE